MPIDISGSGGSTTIISGSGTTASSSAGISFYGTGSISASSDNSLMKVGLLTVARVNVNSVLGITTGSNVTAIKINGPMSSSSEIFARTALKSSGDLLISGSATISGTATVEGDLFVMGTTTTISASNLVIQDPVIGLGFGSSSGGSNLTGAIGDRGFIFGLAGSLNQAILWDETSSSFVMGKVGVSGPDKTAYDITAGNFSTVKVGGLNSLGSISGSAISASGELFAQSNLRTSGSLKVANISGSGEVFGTSLRTSGSLQVSNISGSGEVFGTSFRTSGSLQAGSISGSTSINALGEIIFSNNVSVSGSFTQAGGTNQGSITANGAVNANAGIKTTAYSGSGELFAQTGLRTSGSVKAGSVSGSGGLTVGGEAIFSGDMSMSGTVTAAGTVNIGANNPLALSVTAGIKNTPGQYSGSGEVFTQNNFRTSGSLTVANISDSGEVFGTSFRTSGSLKVSNISGSGEIFGTSFRTSGSVTGSAMSASTTIQGQISGSSMINHWLVIATGNKDLTAAESGKNIFMAAQTTASLPSPETIGLKYHIIASQGFNTSPIKITASNANDNLHGSFVSADGGTNDTADSAYDGIQFTSASVRGDSLTIVSNGSKWFVRGISEKSGAIQYQTGPNPGG